MSQVFLLTQREGTDSQHAMEPSLLPLLRGHATRDWCCTQGAENRALPRLRQSATLGREAGWGQESRLANKHGIRAMRPAPRGGDRCASDEKANKKKARGYIPQHKMLTRAEFF